MVLLFSRNFTNVDAVAQYNQSLSKILGIFKLRQNFNLILMQVLLAQWVIDFSKPFLPEVRENLRDNRRVCRVKQLLKISR